VNMRLAVCFAGKKTHFLDLRIKSYGCLKFQGEIWAGRACAVANEKDLTTLIKFCGQGGWIGGAGDRNSGAPTQWRSLTVPRPLVAQAGRPWPAAGGNRRSPAGYGSQPVYIDKLRLCNWKTWNFLELYVTNFAIFTKPLPLKFCK
jgi:hypothetical protein